MALFDPRAHEPLVDVEWSAAKMRDAVAAIAADADNALRPVAWWPAHPLDDEGDLPEASHTLYLGAAGVLWGLDQLAGAGLHEPGHDYPALAHRALDGYDRAPEFDGPQPSLWLGECGVALVAWLLSPDAAVADRLAALAERDPAGDTIELTWGSPGILLAAGAMLERTGEAHWRMRWQAIADRLLAHWGAEVPGFWTQHLTWSWRTGELLGPAHGFAGIVAALACRPELVPPAELLRLTKPALAATAVHAGGQANWPSARDSALRGENGEIRTQWCHGAPGMVASLASLAPDDELDALLLAGGELTWAAGPLRKGAGLCHGTAGNGFAFLALFARTGDEVWLERARRFAMHAASQVAAGRRADGRGRYTLWTGDVGAALYLMQCLAADGRFPTIDWW